MNRLESLTGFKHRVTSAYHPQSNGLDERLNQTLKASLQKLVNDKQDDWDDLVDDVLFAYRTSRQDSTKFTPSFIMYNREAKLPVEASMPCRSKEFDNANIDEKVKMLVELKKQIHDQVKGNILKAQEKQKRHYERKHNIGSILKVSQHLTRNTFSQILSGVSSLS